MGFAEPCGSEPLSKVIASRLAPTVELFLVSGYSVFSKIFELRW